ncbi:DNA cytosine methyltransferase [Streptomyces malaysiensis]|uniref:DNA (cytosine-5-)-methyltransferase n=1 Tax=Streptomyces malaysiensis TaxID=92644 RepID=A0A7X5XA26_STRMQ|nr:DNA cytosine methyltransferase [Streptomyces malaysiensis]NIY69257.1 hypothetical protein [Streptomyces malaysiensis]
MEPATGAGAVRRLRRARRNSCRQHWRPGHCLRGERPLLAAVFAAHRPGVPSLGDVTAIDWHRVRDVFAPDVIGAGFPCRNISNAGRRDGIHGQWSKVWRTLLRLSETGSRSRSLALPQVSGLITLVRLLCPRQDSNLRTRLRSGFLWTKGQSRPLHVGVEV